MKRNQPQQQQQQEEDPFDFDKELQSNLPSYEDAINGMNEEEPDKPNEEEEDDDDDKIEFVDPPKDKEEEAEDEPEEDEDKNKRLPKSQRKKPTKDESIATLRRQRDEARKFQEAAGDLSAASIQRINEYLNEETGDDDLITDENIQQILSDARNSKKHQQELEEKLKEQEDRIRDLDIRQSSEFQENYLKPYQDKASDLHVEVSNLDENGEAIAPKATNHFFQKLRDTQDLTSQDAKKMLSQFKKEFEQESGEEYDAPSVSAVMTAYRDYQKAAKEANDAYAKWMSDKESQQNETEEHRREKEIQNAKQAKKDRKKSTSKALNNFPLDEYGDAFSRDQIQSTFQEVFKKHEEMFDDPSKAPDYEQAMTRSVKAELFDKIVDEYRQLKEEANSQERENDDQIKNRGKRKPGRPSKKDQDWLDV